MWIITGYVYCMYTIVVVYNQIKAVPNRIAISRKVYYITGVYPELTCTKCLCRDTIHFRFLDFGLFMLNYTLLYNYLCNYITIRLASNSEYLRDSQESNPRHHESPDLVLLNF